VGGLYGAARYQSQGQVVHDVVCYAHGETDNHCAHATACGFLRPFAAILMLHLDA
jgi:hypothetical protein